MDEEARAYGEQLLQRAVDAYEASDLTGCVCMATEAEEIFTILGDRSRVLAARQRQAMVWALNGDLGRAIETNRLLLAHYVALGDEINAAKCSTNLAYNYRLLDRQTRRSRHTATLCGSLLGIRTGSSNSP